MRQLPTYNEPEILARVAKDDEAAFRLLVFQWNQQLTGYVWRVTGSKELAEEIVQDVFVDIWKVRETMSEIINFKHFLLAICRNKALDGMKKQIREQRRKREWEANNKETHDIPDSEHETYSDLIDQAIDSLPPRRKEVYLLSRHERLTYKEIADKLRIGRESVKTHLELASKSITEFITTRLSIIILLTVPPFIGF